MKWMQRIAIGLGVLIGVAPGNPLLFLDRAADRPTASPWPSFRPLIMLSSS